MSFQTDFGLVQLEAYGLGDLSFAGAGAGCSLNIGCCRVAETFAGAGTCLDDGS